MTNSLALPEALPPIPTHARELMGAAPITPYEDLGAYERALAQVAAALKPQDAFEWIWVKDIADLSWEAARARSAKATILQLARKAAIVRINTHTEYRFGLGTTFEDETDQMRALAILNKDPDETGRFARHLARIDLTDQAVLDVAYDGSLDRIERLHRLEDQARTQRDAILRQFERRRDAKAASSGETGRAIDQTIDAVFE